MRNISRLLAWLLVAALVFVTICPINFRPVSGEPVWLERMIPFALLTVLLSIGYPRHRLLILIFAVLGAGSLEAAQMLRPDRHARLPDFYVKAAGCGVGWLVAITTVGLISLCKRFPIRTRGS